jgi:Ni/Fe-hydrogenase subunit HybB-like protein
MLRKVGLGISYCIATIYVVSIVLPAIYCLQHGCKGPGELDAFMPAFMLTPIGGIATVFSLRNAIQQIRKRERWAWVFWPLAIIFAIVLFGIAALVAVFIYYTATHR